MKFDGLEFNELELVIIFFGGLAILSGIGCFVTATHLISILIGLFAVLVGVIGISGIILMATLRDKFSNINKV